MYKSQGPFGPNIDDLYVDGWNPNNVNGIGDAGWGRRDEHKEQSNGPEICWDHEGKAHPLALVSMDDEEKQVSQMRLITSARADAYRVVAVSYICQFAVETPNADY